MIDDRPTPSTRSTRAALGPRATALTGVLTLAIAAPQFTARGQVEAPLPGGDKAGAAGGDPAQPPAQAAAAVGGESFEVVLHRPVEVGAQFTYAAVGRLHEEITVGVDGASAENHYVSYRCDLASAVRVIEVDELGLPRRYVLNIFRFQKQGEGEELALDLLPRGTEVHCTIPDDGEGSVGFEVGGEPVGDEVAEALGIVAWRLSSLPGVSDDKLLGTADAVAAGGSWPVDQALVAAGLAANGFHVLPEHLRGEATLVAASSAVRGGEGFLDVRVDLAADRIAPELPLGYTLETGTLSNTITRRLPGDPHQPCAEETVDLEIIAKAEGKEADSTVRLEIHLRQSLKARTGVIAPRGRG